MTRDDHYYEALARQMTYEPGDARDPVTYRQRLEVREEMLRLGRQMDVDARVQRARKRLHAKVSRDVARQRQQRIGWAAMAAFIIAASTLFALFLTGCDDPYREHNGIAPSIMLDDDYSGPCVPLPKEFVRLCSCLCGNQGPEFEHHPTRGARGNVDHDHGWPACRACHDTIDRIGLATYQRTMRVDLNELIDALHRVYRALWPEAELVHVEPWRERDAI